MKDLHMYLVESMMINENESQTNEIDDIINDYLKKNNFNLIWNTSEVFRYTKVIVSAIRKADVIEAWWPSINPATNSSEDVKKILDDSFAILKIHPEWTLKEFVAYEQSGVKLGEPFKYNERQYEWLLNKILKKYPN